MTLQKSSTRPRSEEEKVRNRATCRTWYAKNADRQKVYQREYRENNKEALRASRQRRKYGVTPEDTAALFAAQNAKCAVCWSPEHGNSKTGWHLDHDHATNAVRGILCHHCNLMLGNARDNPATLRAAAVYLERHKHGGQEETAG